MQIILQYRSKGRHRAGHMFGDHITRYSQLCRHLLLRQIMQFVEDKHLSATLGQFVDDSLEFPHSLLVAQCLLPIDVVRPHVGDNDTGRLRMTRMYLVPSPAVNGPVYRQMTQKGERRMNRLGRRPLQKLNANVLDNVTGKCAIAEAMPNVIDELLVVLDERSDQRGGGGVAVQACHIVTR